MQTEQTPAVGRTNSRSKFDGIRLDDERLFFVALLLAAVPIWLTDYLPGVDLPGQAAQAAALNELWRGNPMFTDLFFFNWMTPYLTGTVILAVLGFVMPVSVATKLLSTFVIVAMPWLFGRVLEDFGGIKALRWLAIPLTYSFSFHWGFFPFFFALPFGLVLLLLTAQFDRSPTVPNGLLVATFSVFLLGSHLLVLCLFALLSLAWLIGQRYRTPLRLGAMSLAYAAPLPFIALWLTSALGSETYMADNTVVFRPFPIKLSQLVSQTAGLDGKFMPIAWLMFVTLISLPLVSRFKLTRAVGKWFMFVAALVVYFGFPTYAMGTAFLYDRFGFVVVLAWLFLWEPTTASTTYRWQVLGIAVVAVCLAVNMLRFSAFDVQARGFNAAIEEIPPSQRVAAFVPQLRSNQFVAPVFMHYVSWYQSERRGVVDFNFGSFYGTVVRYKPGKAPPFGDGLAWQPYQFDWQVNGGENYDYFVVRSPTDDRDAIFKHYRDRVRLVAHHEWWWVYERIEPSGQSPE